MPTALKALFSSSDANAAWSSRVSETESSRMPFCTRLSRSSAEMVATKSARFSCSVSIVRLAAMACTASMKRPSSRLRMPSGRERLAAQRLRCGGHAFDRGLHADVELQFHIHPHAVFGDQRLLARAAHLHAQRAHVDLVHLVQEGQGQAAAGDQHPLATEAGADDGHVATGLAVEAIEEDHHHRDHDDRDDDAEQPGKHEHGRPRGGMRIRCTDVGADTFQVK